MADASRPSLRDGLRFIRALLGAPGFLATVIGAMRGIVTDLIPASGYQDHTTSPSATYRSSARQAALRYAASIASRTRRS